MKTVFPHFTMGSAQKPPLHQLFETYPRETNIQGFTPRSPLASSIVELLRLEYPNTVPLAEVEKYLHTIELRQKYDQIIESCGALEAWSNGLEIVLIQVEEENSYTLVARMSKLSHVQLLAPEMVLALSLRKKMWRDKSFVPYVIRWSIYFFITLGIFALLHPITALWVVSVSLVCLLGIVANSEFFISIWLNSRK